MAAFVKKPFNFDEIMVHTYILSNKHISVPTITSIIPPVNVQLPAPLVKPASSTSQTSTQSKFELNLSKYNIQ